MTKVRAPLPFLLLCAFALGLIAWAEAHIAYFPQQNDRLLQIASQYVAKDIARK
jgi:hypothetical protein